MDKMKMRYTVVSCIFPSNSGEYHSDSKVYNYIIEQSPSECNINKNTLFKVYDELGFAKYNGVNLLCIKNKDFIVIKILLMFFKNTFLQ